MDEKELQLKVCDYLKNKIEYLDNKYYYSSTCARDLNSIYKLIKESIFIKQDSLVIDDILMLIPKGRDSKLKLIYTDELLNFDIEIIIVKLVAEILLYHTGMLIFKENKLISYLYVYLINLQLILEIEQAEDNYLSIRSKIYNTISKSYPEIIEKYGLQISNEKRMYYINFSLNNFKDYVSSLFISKETTFLNGSVAEYDVLLTRSSQVLGIEIMYKALYSSNSFSFDSYKVDIGFEEYESLLNHYLNEQARKRKLKTVFFNSNHDLITDKKEMIILNDQYKVLLSLC